MATPVSVTIAPTSPHYRRFITKWKHPALVVAVAAFLARVALIIITHSYAFPGLKYSNYAFGFETGSIAGSLATGQGFSSPFGVPTGPTAWIGPIYPALLAGIFKIFGLYSTPSAIAILVVNSIFAALTCALIYELGRELFDSTVALLAAWSFALVPFFMRWPVTWAWDQALSAFLLSLLVLIAVRLRSLEWKQWISYGALWGISSLANPALLGVMPIALAYAGWPWRRRALARIAAALVATVLVISPWLLRNRIAMGHWVFLRDNFGLEFSIGNYRGSMGILFGGMHPQMNPVLMEQYKRLGEVEFCRQRFQVAKSWVSAHPRDFAELTLKRSLDFWDGWALTHEPRSEPWKPWMVALTSALAWLGMLFMLTRRVRGRFLLLGIMLLYPLPYYITYTNPRYRHVIEPEMVLMSAFLVWVFYQELRDKVLFLPGLRGRSSHPGNSHPAE